MNGGDLVDDNTQNLTDSNSRVEISSSNNDPKKMSNDLIKNEKQNGGQRIEKNTKNDKMPERKKGEGSAERTVTVNISIKLPVLKIHFSQNLTQMSFSLNHKFISVKT